MLRLPATPLAWATAGATRAARLSQAATGTARASVSMEAAWARPHAASSRSGATPAPAATPAAPHAGSAKPAATPHGMTPAKDSKEESTEQPRCKSHQQDNNDQEEDHRARLQDGRELDYRVRPTWGTTAGR